MLFISRMILLTKAKKIMRQGIKSPPQNYSGRKMRAKILTKRDKI